MVIDDSNTIRRSAEIFLLQAGCAVILPKTASDALAKIADHHPDCLRRHHDAAASTVIRPVRSSRRMRSSIRRPVIMLSSKDGLFDRARGRMVGSDQYLTKPFTKESRLKAVRTHVVRPASSGAASAVS
jgi:twitching motility two-component system response regulator PilG